VIFMKAFAILGSAVLFLSLGIVVPAFAQQGQEEAKPEQKQKQEQAQPQQQAKPSQDKSTQPQQHAQQQGQAKQAQPAEQQSKSQPAQAPQHAQQQSQAKQAHPAKQQGKNQPAQPQQQNQKQRQPQQQAKQPAQHTQEQQHAQQAAWQGHRSQNWQSDHRTWQQRGGYNGYRIPDNRYNGYFGQDHAFVIYSQPYMVVGGFPRFQYNGFWFSLVDPWPGDWSDNWYETDEVYVVYVDNGYYMYNQRYPGVGIAISVSM